MNDRNNKVKTIVSIIITVLSLVFVGFVLIGGSKDAEMIVNTETYQLEISGGIFYNKTIDIDEDTFIQIVSPLSVVRRTNGSAVGNTLKGFFTLEGDISAYLCLGDKTNNWILIQNGDDINYVNFQDEEDTTSLYTSLLALQ